MTTNQSKNLSQKTMQNRTEQKTSKNEGNPIYLFLIVC